MPETHLLNLAHQSEQLDISIVNGRIVDPANNIDAVMDLHIQNGKILALGQTPGSFIAQKVIDANNKVVCPGLVDMRMRLREPGHETKGTIASETRAAAAGGVTALCCPPDTDPIIDNAAMVKLIRLKAVTEGVAKVYTLSALTQQLKGEKLSEMRELKDAGCVGTTNALNPVKSTLVMRRALEYAASHGITVFIHPFDPWLSDGCAHEGVVSTRLGLAGIPDSAETIAIARDLQLIELIGAKAHFCQLSSAGSIGFFDSNCHVIPPLRTQRDMEALRHGVHSGILSCIVSDHQPHDSDAKLAPFAETEPGISGVETLLPLALKLMESHNMPLMEVISRLTIQPAKILTIPEGTLGIGQDADICIFDPEAWWRVDKEKFLSRGKNTPFHGWELKGQVEYTIMSGEIVYSRG